MARPRARGRLAEPPAIGTRRVRGQRSGDSSVPEARFRDRGYASRLRASEGCFRRCLRDGALAPPSAVPSLLTLDG